MPRVAPGAVALWIAAVSGAPAEAGVFNPTTFTLDNGLQVVAVENARAPIVVHTLWYKVGAADEPPGKSGVAHFLEHLMFKGTPTVPSGRFSKIVAANGGSDNAFTSQDYTAYVQRVASDKLELVMRMEADRMTNLRLTDEKAAPERGVVQEERRQRTANSPSAQLYERRRAVTYLRHPYRIPVIGWKSEIDGLTAEDALAFYRRHYAPNNAILIVAGDATADEVRRLAEKYYGAIPRRPVPRRARPQEPDQLAAKRITMKSPLVHVPSVSITWRAPSYAAGETRHAYPLLLLSDILGGGSTSRLHRRLAIEEKAASGAGAGYLGTALDMGEFSVSASALAGGDIVRIETLLKEEIGQVLQRGVTEAELARSKRAMLAGAIYARDGLRAAPRAIGRALTTGRTIADVEAWPERIREVTAAAVLDAARAVFVERRSVTAVLLPGSSG
ncbi:MAG: pitrilysin family protein [Defluviicoccus sp.]|nr:pitrilysin family protein [Defluviicoccus sp.]